MEFLPRRFQGMQVDILNHLEVDTNWKRNASLTPIERAATLGDEAYAKLRSALMSGNVRPGERLVLRALASALGVSLTPAREALGRLVAEGALSLGPHRSVWVPKLDAIQYEECMQIRLALEPLAASRSVLHLTSKDIESLRLTQEELRSAHGSGDTRRVLECNQAFHFTLYRKADMPTLLQIVESLWLRIGPTLNLLHESVDVAQPWRGDINHRAILTAAETCDAEAIYAAVRQDLLDGSARLAPLLRMQ
jgi:DNA-binding GntR family transcriptional regulator